MINVDDVKALNAYINGVIDRADHHALNVKSVCISLLGAILWKNTGQVKIKEYSGEMKNQIWFKCNNVTYNLIYNHDAEIIELRVKKIVIGKFSDKTSHTEMRDIFENL